MAHVQKRTSYSPEIEFAAFDVVVDGKYLDYTETISKCNAAGVPVLPILEKGTLERLISLSPIFNSTMSRGDLEVNEAEGYVLRPNTTFFFDSDGNLFPLPDYSKGIQYRTMLKHKNPKFLERAPAKDKSEKTEKTAEFVKVAVVKGYICANRLDNLISKIGEVADKTRIAKELAEDAFKDYEKENDVEDEKTVMRILTTEAFRLVFSKKE